MATLTVNGTAVKVDNSFLSLSPADQEKTVNEIAAQLKPQATPSAAPKAGLTPDQAQAAINASMGGGVIPAFNIGGISIPSFNLPNMGTAPMVAMNNMGDAATLGLAPLAGRAIGNAIRPGAGDQTQQGMDALSASNPVAAAVGQTAGTIAPLAIAGGTQIGGRLLGTTGNVGSRIAAGAASSGAMGGIGTLAHGGSPQDAMTTGALDAAVGGAIPGVGAVVKGIAGAAKPSVALDALQAAKNAAYAKADGLGAAYSADGYDRMVSDLVAEAKADSISPDRHPKAASMLMDLANKPAGYSPSLTDLDNLRQTVRRDVANASDDAEAHFGKQMLDGIDHFIANAGPGDMASGAAPEAAGAITAARSANQVYKKVETIDDLVTKAQRQAASTGSGGNINNALRQGVRRILDSKSKSAGFLPSELAAMENIVRGSAGENAARLVGKLSPNGNGLMAALGIGGIAANPLLALAPAAGMAAKHISDTRTLNKLMGLRNLIASAGAATAKAAPPRALFPPAAVPLLGNQAAAPLQITVRGAAPAYQ